MSFPLKGEKQSLPIIRKVIRKDGFFVCCICRSEHELLAEAQDCLDACWSEIRNYYPVTMRRVARDDHLFRCNYCSRDYDTESAALECANACIAERSDRHLQELEFFQAEDGTHRKPRPSRILVARIQRSVGPRLRRFAHANVLNSVNSAAKMEEIDLSHVDTVPADSSPPATPESASKAPLGGSPPGAASAPPQEKQKSEANGDPSSVKLAEGASRPTSKAKHRDSFPKTWVRQDAKYQCFYCKKRFYTKSEVESCFNDHFDDSGMEKLPGGASG